MINAGEIVIAIMTMVALAETIYLRKELEEHGLHFWVYAAFPLMALTSFVLIAWHELPDGMAESLSYFLGVLTVVAFFIGIVIALRRR
ncbi:MAG: hypothetical protein QW505_03710 [Thermoplasmata archaeon]